MIGHVKDLPRMVALGGAGLFVQELLVLFLASLVVKWIFNMVNSQQMTWCVQYFQAFGNIVVWGLIAPSLDILIYSEPASKVFTQGVFATVSNIVAVGIIGTLLMKAYASTRTKKGSLSKIKKLSK